MSTASARILLDVEIREIISDGVKRGHISPRIKELLDFRNGTANNQVNKVYGEHRTAIAASTTTVIDLIGSLTDEDGDTINFDEVAFIVIKNLRTTALAYLLVGPDATNGFGTLASSIGFWNDATDRSVVESNGGWLALYSPPGVPAAAGSTDELAIISSGVAGSTNEWVLIIGGRDN